MSYNHGLPIRFRGVSHVITNPTGNDATLGQETYDSDGNKYVWVYNACNSQIIPGLGVVIQSSVSTAYSMTLTSVTSADQLLGVVKHATIPTGSYGWVLTRGIGKVKMMATSGTVAARALLDIGADGFFYGVSNTTGNLSPAKCQAIEAIVSSAVGSAFINLY